MKLLSALLLEDGQGLNEYSLILGLLVVAAASGLAIAGTKIIALYNDTRAEIELYTR